MTKKRQRGRSVGNTSEESEVSSVVDRQEDMIVDPTSFEERIAKLHDIFSSDKHRFSTKMPEVLSLLTQLDVDYKKGHVSIKYDIHINTNTNIQYYRPDILVKNKHTKKIQII